jgi:hypothetical protein
VTPTAGRLDKGGLEMQGCDVQECLAYAQFYWESTDGARVYRCQAHEYHLVPQGAVRHEYHLVAQDEDQAPHPYRIVPEQDER